MILCQTAVYFKNSSYKTYWQIMAYKPNLACCLFLYNPWAKNGCYIFKWLKKIFCDVWKSYEIQILMSIKFYENIPIFIIYILPMAALWLKHLSWIVMKEIIRLTKREMFNICPFTEKVFQHWFKNWKTRAEEKSQEHSELKDFSH